ncbi:Chromosome partitioning protein ParB [Vibrio crassostreae]|uniref:chromosome partitioning protein ParB n=1 Tax=Vibrio crassostreae TaxID=246167 RepID=UPI001BD5DC92|nr:chromosome partitioning protein ParB [Vibrio crassostreae]CAK1756365.1 Chromosome partitioning protein ParB [Vibrio crassostreae]CAK1758955.1 Chromosome partitioning protein ParB [Vibrio crassostreae]CAK2375902.1 Chromosome partitioning protein ParB [Vibrio crassostreae]CAK2386698.1 Chromosome partitioning protein ParB [Vibrio crassostreae]CAK2386714.1 Chromosome partitioning protein ParB [Vibrio crassostreae]
MTNVKAESLNEIADEALESSIIKHLVERYEDKESNTYLASSKELMETASSTNPQQIMEIFKSQAQYYSGVKTVHTTLRYVVLLITPQLARDMLTFSRRGAVNPNNKNRKLSRAKLKKYAEAMKKSQWCLTGEPIIISIDGEILNGHHRLQAAFESNSNFIAPITYGVTDILSFAHIDVGNTRTRSQVLEMAGVKVSAPVLSRVAMLSKAFDATPNPYAFRGTQGTSFQPAEILAYVEENEELALSVDFVSKVVKRHKLESQVSEAIYAFAHSLIKRQLKENPPSTELPLSPETYLSRIISSLGLESEDDIEYQVRNYLQSLVHESTSYSLLCKLSAIFKGWNIHLGIPVVGNKVSVRRVARYRKDEDGNKIPMQSAGNINEAFTIPCMIKGGTPKRISKQANVQTISR